jgi:hypothetical protein
MRRSSGSAAPGDRRASGNLDLARKVLEALAEAVGFDNNVAPGVSSLEYAKVFTKLLEQDVRANDPNIKRRVDDHLDEVQEFGEERPLHEFEINLPDLESTTMFEVVGDHCKLFGSFIFSSAFEELGAFRSSTG